MSVRRIIAVLMLASLVELASAQTFQDFLNRVNSVPDSQRTAIVDSFMNAAGAFPYLEHDTLAHFIWRGSANSVTVPGDANNWDVNAFNMTRISGTDFWYHSHVFESDARLDYKFVLNGSTWILDPRNPHTCTGGYGPNSELAMPQYVPAPEIADDGTIPHGTLRDTTFYSTNLGNSRTVRVYTPPGYDSTSDVYPWILVHDGLEYVSLANMDHVLNYLIAHRRMRPVIAVFVPPVNREAEYAGNLMNEFSTFIVDELLPWFETRYRVRPEADQHATLGASNGGNISLWLGVQYPEVFGNVAAQSSNVVNSISNRLQSDPQLALRFYLDLGTYDIPQLIPLVRNLVQILDAHGYEYRYQEYHEGHSWGNWRAHIDNALEMFFPGDSASAVRPSHVLQLLALLGNYPNPFNAATTVSFSVAMPQRVSLQVYDLQGRLVTTLLDSPMTAGVHEVTFDARDLSSGIYFCRLAAGADVMTRKMLLVK